jgi:hypothetical protein
MRRDVHAIYVMSEACPSRSHGNKGSESHRPLLVGTSWPLTRGVCFQDNEIRSLSWMSTQLIFVLILRDPGSVFVAPFASRVQNVCITYVGSQYCLLWSEFLATDPEVRVRFPEK